ncbi:MAG TPA: lysophospholipid acyltransferase family protein [Chitinophagaceae bacterium]|nr:lysophospholipid acyltransferase family protein [Chitinophagaceae bacterium]
MRRIRQPLQWAYCIYALLVFVAVMLVLFPLVILASLLGRIRGGNLVYRLCMLWADIWFPLVGIRPRRLYEAPYDPSRPCIFVANHISYLDAALVVKAFRRPLRPLGKVELSKIPVFGFIYRNAIVTVDRSSPENRADSVRILKSVLRHGISVLVFPEGTFNLSGAPLKSFYDGAFRIAVETQTPIRPVLFLDNYDRLHYARLFSLTPGRCRAVYLEEVPVAGLGPEQIPGLRDRVHALMEERLRHYGASWVTSGED